MNTPFSIFYGKLKMVRNYSPLLSEQKLRPVCNCADWEWLSIAMMAMLTTALGRRPWMAVENEFNHIPVLASIAEPE